MATGRFDLPDAALSPIFVAASMISLGLIDSQWFGIDFANAVYTFSGSSGSTEITIATVISLAVIGYAYYTNRQDISSFERLEIWIITATVALILAPPFVPILEDLVSGGDFPAFIALIIQAGGYYSLSFTG
ncbi:hypothetical protein [Haloarcula montana]|uniref:hypothetical protein n=1 Tax=Haloarcula montana TaxID=3111776 RepID=UPI002D7A3DEF|nr:hypothetical protein [Haloarcula sp. GH36]